jgi:hypothetical protein
VGVGVGVGVGVCACANNCCSAYFGAQAVTTGMQ